MPRHDPVVAKMKGEHILDEQDLPHLFQAADRATQKAQKATLTLTATRLVTAVIAALVGTFGEELNSREVLSVVAAAAFFVTLVTERQLGLAASPQSRWYEGRALAESVKTLAWRFAVGGNPFAVAREPAEVEEEFGARLRELLSDARPGIIDTAVSPGPQISSPMRELRAAPLERRRDAYLSERLQQQRLWYAQRARKHGSRGRWWRGILLAAEVAGAIGAVLGLVKSIEVNFLALAGAVLAAGAAWTQTRQHDALAAAYSRTFQELSVISDLPVAANEEQWARFVADTEAAISREHTSWVASRGAALRSSSP
jgi:hypothetical protein